jgi:hypothetical protein
MRRLEEPAERMLGNCQVTVREYVRLEKIAELIVNPGLRNAGVPQEDEPADGPYKNQSQRAIQRPVQPLHHRQFPRGRLGNRLRNESRD